MEAAVKKSSGIDALISGYSPNKVEEEKKVQRFDGRFARLLKKYEYLVSKKEYVCDSWGFEGLQVEHKKIQQVLTPDEINQFFQLTKAYETKEYHGDITGEFITVLIRNSYKAGYNDFTLDASMLLPLRRLGSRYLSSDHVGQKEGNLVRMFVDGDLGYGCFGSTEWVEVVINGNVENSFASFSKNCIFTFQGGHDHNFFFPDTSGNTYKTSDRKVLEKLLEGVPQLFWERGGGLEEKPSGNKIIFIHEDGKEEIVKDYGKVQG